MPNLDDDVVELKVAEGRLDERLKRVEQYTATMNGRLTSIQDDIGSIRNTVIEIKTENSVTKHLNGLNRALYLWMGTTGVALLGIAAGIFVALR